MSLQKLLISLMKALGRKLDQAADVIVGGVVYSERCHRKYAFEAPLSPVMMTAEGDVNRWFELSQFDHVMSFGDPFDALLDEPDSGVARLYRMRYLAAVYSQMEFSFFGHLDQRSFVKSGGDPRTPFCEGLARWVWALEWMFAARKELSYVRSAWRVWLV